MGYTVGGAFPVTESSTPNVTKRDKRTVSLIVLHSTGGSFESAVNWLSNPQSKVSAHYVVARDGRITQLAQTKNICWHAGVSFWKGNPFVNSISIGIEMEHIDGKDDWPMIQVQAVAALCRFLCRRFALNAETQIVGHCHVCVPRGRKIDPKGFPWVTFCTQIEEGANT